jgi:hypothetical protein
MKNVIQFYCLTCGTTEILSEERVLDYQFFHKAQFFDHETQLFALNMNIIRSD